MKANRISRRTFWAKRQEATAAELVARIRWLRRVHNAACRFRGVRWALLLASVLCLLVVYEPWLPTAHYVGVALAVWPVTAWLVRFHRRPPNSMNSRRTGKSWRNAAAFEIIKQELDDKTFIVDLDE